jgi:uncharacterized protein YuzE
MRIEYDSEADVLYIALRNVRVARTVEVEGSLVVDYGEDGRLVGIEILDIAGLLDAETLARMAERTAEAARDGAGE